MHYYPHNIPDFNNSTRHLTRVERSVYRDAIELYYDTESVLTKDLNSLSKKLLCRSDEEKQALKDVIDEFFTETEEGYSHERCEKEIAKYRANASAKAKAGKASAEARKQKAAKRKQKSTGVEQPLNSVEQTKNQELRTKNQELEDKKQAKKSSDFVLPDWINKLHWDIWISKNKKKTNEQKQLAVDKLKRWKEAGLNHGQALEDAAEGGWQGLHEPKPSRVQKPDRQTTNEQTTKAAYKKIFGVDMDANQEKDVTHESARL